MTQNKESTRTKTGSIYEPEKYPLYPIAGVTDKQPEDADKKPWEYKHSEDGHGETRNASRKMTVPVGTSPMEQFVRVHEMGHAKWSRDRKLPGSMGEVHSSIEEARVNSLMFDRAIRPEVRDAYVGLLDLQRDKLMRENFQAWSPRNQALAILGSAGYHMDISTLDKDQRGFVENILSEYAMHSERKHDDSWMKKVCEDFERMFKHDETRPMPNVALGVSHQIIPGAMKPSDMRKGGNEFPDIDHKTEQGKYEKHEWRIKDDKNQWGDMVIQLPPLVRPAKNAGIVRKQRKVDYGAVFKNTHRIITDKMVFTRKKKTVSGGSLLLDCSGSMSITYEQIEEFLKAAPAAEIALYSGGGSGTGYLRLVAKGGKMATKDHLKMPGANEVDGPALRWLATRPEPRYHVSDGQATGAREQVYDQTRPECESIRRENRIEMISDMDSALEKIKGKVKGGGWRKYQE